MGTKLWTGNVSTDWNNASNWSPTQLPGVSDDVTIGTAGNNPTLSGGGIAHNLTINSGATLAIIGDGTLDQYGSLLINPSISKYTFTRHI